MTYGLEGRRSIHLSYGRRKPASVGALGFEPRTSCSQSRRANRAALRPAHNCQLQQLKHLKLIETRFWVNRSNTLTHVWSECAKRMGAMTALVFLRA
jgi:hypothetical protein